MRVEQRAATLGARKKGLSPQVVVRQEQTVEVATARRPEHRGAEAERFSAAQKQCLAWQQPGTLAAQPQEQRPVLQLPYEDARPQLALLLQESLHAMAGATAQLEAESIQQEQEQEEPPREQRPEQCLVVLPLR
ncbi:MAG TPA: hypothetical protein VNE63_19850 [Candidatus Acidoferrales bacterium]|nr:hypothetical protein [Candidatus Acidoferrales bacterium]